MRWQVEMTPIGKTDAQSVVVEAESWQKALQGARSLRGEGGPMSGFSIELLEQGYRAVDPMARLIYTVKRAADDAAVTSTLTGVQKPDAAKIEAAAAVPAPPPPPVVAESASKSVRPPPRPVSGPAPSTGKHPLSQTLAFGSGGAAFEAVAPKPAAVAVPAPTHTERMIPTAASDPDDTLANTAVSEDAATYIDKGSHDNLAPSPPSLSEVPATQVIFKREQDPTPQAPLTYREYVYAVATGTKEDDAERVLLAQFELVRKALESARAGKLVNMAVFDVVFKGKPPTPPLATLAWKDWKGAPTVEFPRRRPAKPAPAPQPQPAAVAPKAVVVPPPAALFQAQPANTLPLAGAPIPPPPPQVMAQAQAHAPQPQMPAGKPPAPRQEPAAAAFPAAAAPLAPNPTPGPGPTNRPSQARGPAKAPPRGRAHGDELITVLFEAMHDLHFLRDAIEGGDFCLSLALETLPSAAGIVHMYDIDKREFIVAATSGKGAEKLLTRRYPETDPLLSKAMRKRLAVVVTDASREEGADAERYTLLGGAVSIMVAPVLHGGRFIGAIEIINPADGMPFNEAEGNALNYIAEQYAEFVAQRGVVIDNEAISMRPGQLRAR